MAGGRNSCSRRALTAGLAMMALFTVAAALLAMANESLPSESQASKYGTGACVALIAGLIICITEVRCKKAPVATQAGETTPLVLVNNDIQAEVEVPVPPMANLFHNLRTREQPLSDFARMLPQTRQGG